MNSVAYSSSIEAHRMTRPVRFSLVVLLVIALAGGAALAFGEEPGSNETSSAAAVADTSASSTATAMPEATPLASGIVRETLMVSGYTDEGIAYDLLLAPPVFFESVHRPDNIARVGADKYVVFLIAEHHFHESTSHPEHFGLMPILKIDGRSVHVARTKVELSNDGHHRTTALVFEELPVDMLSGDHRWDMIMPEGVNGDRVVHTWVTPIEFPDAASGTSA